MTKAEVVRACFASYVNQDRQAAERLIADDFVFTSPQDDHTGRAAFFARCFPTMGRLRSHELLQVVPSAGDDIFVLYKYELRTGERYRNTEVLTVRDDKIVETQVFFGGRVSA